MSVSEQIDARIRELGDWRGFNSSLEGNTRRAIDFHGGDMVDEEALTALIHAAAALNSRKRK